MSLDHKVKKKKQNPFYVGLFFQHQSAPFSMELVFLLANIMFRLMVDGYSTHSPGFYFLNRIQIKQERTYRSGSEGKLKRVTSESVFPWSDPQFVAAQQSVILDCMYMASKLARWRLQADKPTLEKSLQSSLQSHAWCGICDQHVEFIATLTGRIYAEQRMDLFHSFKKLMVRGVPRACTYT